jgi:outer membrane protein OmpA-like peptidoglycan-associated protein
MVRVSISVVLTLLAAGLTTTAQAAPPRDARGCRDTSLFTRMPHYYISRCEDADFVAERITTPQGEVTVKGRKSVLYYSVTPGASGASSAEILGNYQNAIEAIGGTVTWSSRFHAHMRLEASGVKSWIKLSALNPRNYSLTIIEERKMEQVVQADSDAWLKDIIATGRAAVYGIYFDTGKAVVKDESKPTLAEMAKLLKGHPTLNVYIVGHTDSTGSYQANVRLSRQRASAVVRALVSKYGVPSSRLQAAGVGPLSPAASNRGEAGRAKNRRVELVEK